MEIMAVTAVGAGAVLLTIGLRLGSKLGRAHAIVGQKPSLASEAYRNGYAAGQRLAGRAGCVASRVFR